MELAQKAFGDWKAAGPAVDVFLTPPQPLAATHIYLIDRPGAQSQIRVGQLGLTRKDPLYITSRVVDGYFGRGFGSRLNRSLRVDKGLTYGIGGGFAPQRLEGRYSIGTFSKTDSTPAAVRAILDELKRLHDVPPTEAELADTRAFMLGSFAAAHETPAAVAGDLWLLESEGLPSDWFNKMLAKVATVSADECADFVRKTIDDSHLVIVVVGEADKLKKPLEAIAPVTVVESGKPPASRPASAPSTKLAGMNTDVRR
jgi:zinc protease